MATELVKLALQLMQFPTVTGREDLCAEFVEQELVRAGLAVHRQEILGVGHNLVAARGQGGPWIITHLDVFPPFEHPAPFSARVEDHFLVGRGAVDTKGQIAALLWALRHTKEPVQVALVVDEEELGRGSEALAVPPGVRGAVVLEPTRLELAPAEAGSIGLEVLVAGRAAHGSMPWTGESAIERAFQLYQRLREQPFMRHHHHLFPYGAWVNLGKIEGGYDTMVVPPHCRMELDIGFAPGLSVQEVLQQVHEAFREAERLFVTDAWEPWETDPQAEVVQALRSAVEEVVGQSASFTGMPSWTDAHHVVEHGVPAVVFGAGDLAVAHTWHEALSVEELTALAEILARLIRRWE